MKEKWILYAVAALVVYLIWRHGGVKNFTHAVFNEADKIPETVSPDDDSIAD